MKLPVKGGVEADRHWSGGGGRRAPGVGNANEWGVLKNLEFYERLEMLIAVDFSRMVEQESVVSRAVEIFKKDFKKTGWPV